MSGVSAASFTQSAGLLVSSVFGTLVFTMGAVQSQVIPNPWINDPQLAQAVVHISGEDSAGKEITGTGFILQGQNDRVFVLTSTHVLYSANQAPEPCTPLPNKLELRVSNSGGPVVKASGGCGARNLGNDASLIELAPRDEGYKVLEPTICNIGLQTQLFLAGFPLGLQRDDLRNGVVTATSGENGTIVTNIPTARGFSGGPYLTENGQVAGFHRGGAKYVANFAHMQPLSSIRGELQNHIPAIGGDGEDCPKAPSLHMRVEELRGMLMGKAPLDEGIIQDLPDEGILQRLTAVEDLITDLQILSEDLRRQHQFAMEIIHNTAEKMTLRIVFQRQIPSEQHPGALTLNIVAYKNRNDASNDKAGVPLFGQLGESVPRLNGPLMEGDRETESWYDYARLADKVKGIERDKNIRVGALKVHVTGTVWYPNKAGTDVEAQIETIKTIDFSLGVR